MPLTCPLKLIPLTEGLWQSRGLRTASKPSTEAPLTENRRRELTVGNTGEVAPEALASLVRGDVGVGSVSEIARPNLQFLLSKSGPIV